MQTDVARIEYSGTLTNGDGCYLMHRVNNNRYYPGFALIAEVLRAKTTMWL